MTGMEDLDLALEFDLDLDLDLELNLYPWMKGAMMAELIETLASSAAAM